MIDTDLEWLEGEPMRGSSATVPILGMTKRELASALDWPIKRIDKLCREGLPARSMGSNRGGLRFDLPVVVEWLCSQAAGDDDSMAEARLQSLLARTRKQQIEADQLAGKLIEIDAVIALNSKTFGEIRGQLISLSSQVTTLSVEQREQLDAAINDVLRDIQQISYASNEHEESESIAA